MSFVGVRISLLSAPDDPPVDDGALQSTFGRFRQFLRISDIPVSTPMFYQDVETEGAAEGYAGEFIVPLPQTLLPPLSTIVSAWLEQRPGRTSAVENRRELRRGAVDRAGRELSVAGPTASEFFGREPICIECRRNRADRSHPRSSSLLTNGPRGVVNLCT